MFNIEIDVPCILDSNRSCKDLQELFRALKAQLWRPAAVLCNVLATAVEPGAASQALFEGGTREMQVFSRFS